MHSPVGVPPNAAPTSTWLTEPSFANVTVVDALPHALPRRHFAMSRHLPSRARTAAALRNGDGPPPVETDPGWGDGESGAASVGATSGGGAASATDGGGAGGSIAAGVAL